MLEMQAGRFARSDKLKANKLPFRRRRAVPDDTGQLAFSEFDCSGTVYRNGMVNNYPSAVQ